MIRLQILLPPTSYDALRNAAARSRIPAPLKAAEYIEDGIEDEEDELWDDFVEVQERTQRSHSQQSLMWPC